VIVLFYFDWFGSQKELSEMEKSMTTALKGSGIKYEGTYAPDMRKFHYVAIYETNSYDKFMEALLKGTTRRDYKKLTHGTFEVLRGPLR
jgi:hypothetical protein